MGDETYIETERVRSRAEIAAYLHEFATRFEEGKVAFEEEGERFTVAAPSRALFEVEVECEQEDDETEYEIEFEIEWPERWNETGDAEREADREADDLVTDAGSAGDAGPTEEPGVTPDDDAAGRVVAAEEDDDREATGPLSVTTPPESRARFELFRDRADEWRWRLVHDNGNVVAASGEGYTTKWNARKGLRSVVRNAPGAEVVER